MLGLMLESLVLQMFLQLGLEMLVLKIRLLQLLLLEFLLRDVAYGIIIKVLLTRTFEPTGLFRSCHDWTKPLRGKPLRKLGGQLQLLSTDGWPRVRLLRACGHLVFPVLFRHV